MKVKSSDGYRKDAGMREGGLFAIVHAKLSKLWLPVAIISMVFIS